MDLPFDGVLALRRRSGWEAADAGILLWRKDFLYFLPFFALPVWICAFSLRLLPDRLWPLSWLVLWYLRPFFDRLALHVVSARFFGSSENRPLIRRLLPNLFRGLGGDLLWRRFSPWRSAMIPVRTLERLGPARTRHRKNTLSGGGIDFCVFLSVWSLALEAILLGGEILFALISFTMIRPGYIGSPAEFFAGKEIFLYTAWCVNSLFTETLYVCMGFSLYINSRVEVEGWDLELLFRALKRDRRKNFPAPGAALLLGICLFAALPSSAFAEPPIRPIPPIPPIPAPGAGGDAPLEALQRILESPEFGGEKESRGIRFRHREPGDRRFFRPTPWLSDAGRIFALVLRAFLVLAFLVLGIFCALYLYRQREPGKAGEDRGKTRALPGETPEDPGKLLREALDFHRAGKIREAWARCFAASLAAWSGRVSFPAGATEYRCLALVQSLPPVPAAPDQPNQPDHPDQSDQEARAGFAGLIANWVAFAYGGRLPPEGAFEQALAWIGDLCGNQAEHRGSLP